MTWPLLLELELLVRSDQLGSLSAAARELGLSQPEASRRLTRLESELDLRLLVRTHTGSHLTASGTLVAEWSHQLLDQATQWQAGVASLHARMRTQLSLSASQTIAEYLAPRWLALFRMMHDGALPQLAVHNSAQVVKRVEEGAAELGLVETPGAPTGLESAIIGHDRLVVVVDPAHPWRRRRSITVADLAATPLVVRELGSGTRETLEAALEGLHCESPALELTSNAAVLAAAAAGAGPAVISGLATRGAIADSRLHRVPLVGNRLERDLRAVWKPDTALSRTAQEFLALVGCPRPGKP